MSLWSLCDFYLQSLPFQVNRNIQETRPQNNIFQSRPMHEYAKNCIQYNIPNTVNNIINNIIDKIYTHSIYGFSGYLKQGILQSYQERCTIPNYSLCSRS